MTPLEPPDHQTGTMPTVTSLCSESVQDTLLSRGAQEKLVSAPNALNVFKIRKDFIQAARAGLQGTSSMMVQARQRHEGEAATGVRVGFTCSKKVGNAVARNRAKRRLPEAARAILPEHGRTGWDYVLIGRAIVTDKRDFNALKGDLAYALRKLHGTSGDTESIGTASERKSEPGPQK